VRHRYRGIGGLTQLRRRGEVYGYGITTYKRWYVYHTKLLRSFKDTPTT
jgi:hypothetical protein